LAAALVVPLQLVESHGRINHIFCENSIHHITFSIVVCHITMHITFFVTICDEHEASIEFSLDEHKM
jgi:hypothetical protein